MHCGFVRKAYLGRLLFILLLGLCVFPGRVLSQGNKTSITIAYCKDCFPFQFTNEKGEPDGIVMDYWKGWSEKAPLPVAFIPASWKESIEMVRSSRADFHAGLGYTPERAGFLHFGASICKADTHVFFHKDFYSSTVMKDITAFRIGVIAGDMAQPCLEKKYPDATVIGFETYDALINALQNDRIKVFAADRPTALYHLQLNGLQQRFLYHADKPLIKGSVRVAGGDGTGKLMEEINRWMEKFPPGERRKINRKWSIPGYVDDSKTLVIAVPRDLPPFSMIGPDGNAIGFLVEFWQLWSRTTGVPIYLLPGSWLETIEYVRSGKADIHNGVVKNEDLDTWMDFSSPIYQAKTGLFFRPDEQDLSSLEEMGHVRVGVMSGSYQEKFLKERYPEIIRVTYPRHLEMVTALLKGETQAIVDQFAAVESSLRLCDLQGVLSRYKHYLFKETVHAGIHKGNDALKQVIDDGLKKIPDAALMALEEKWFPDSTDPFYRAKAYSLELTDREKEWLRTHPRVRVAAMDAWPPMDFVDTMGKPAGIGADYVYALNKRLGGVLEITPGPFNENLSKVKAGQLDAILDITPLPDREKHLNFTRPYLTIPHVIVARKGGAYYESEASLTGKTLALEKGFFSVNYFKEKYPDIKVEEYPDTARALDAVARGLADAYAGNRAVAAWVMEQEIMSTLQIQGRLNKKGSVLAIGVRKD